MRCESNKLFCKRREQTGLQTVHYDKYEKRQSRNVMTFSYTDVNSGLRTKSTEGREQQNYFWETDAVTKPENYLSFTNPLRSLPCSQNPTWTHEPDERNAELSITLTL